MQKITTFLWFDSQALEAAKFYVSIFKNSQIVSPVITGDDAAGPVFLVNFTLDGHEFMALNGGPHYTITPGISFFVNCEGQEEVDDLWTKLGEGGKDLQCGWLTDRFGITWQIIPSALGELMSDPDPIKAARVRNAMMQMVKIDIAGLQKAYDGE
jgi:predicted 3-demethylubiquinone-9 3-methyltransferase (glyoxalase superfamily)